MKHEHGFSIVELMVAIAIGLLITLAVGTVYLANSQSYRILQNQVRIQDTARHALGVMGREIRSSDWNSSQPFSLSVNGYYQDDWQGGGKDLSMAGHTYEVGDFTCWGGLIAGTTITSTRFSVDGSNLVCARSALEASVAFASNIENFQVSYSGGSGTGAAISNAAGLVANGGTMDHRAVRVCITVRSEDDNLLANPQRYLNCAGALGEATGSAAFTTAADRRIYRTFVSTNAVRSKIRVVP